MGHAVAFFGMLFRERGVSSLVREDLPLQNARPNLFTCTYFITRPAAECAIQRPGGNLTRLSPPE